MKKHILIIVILMFLSILISKSVFAGADIVIPKKTLIISPEQFPKELKISKPSSIYLCIEYLSERKTKNFIKNDTIINLKGFLDSFGKRKIHFYRLIFKNNSGSVDSFWQCNSNYKLNYKAYPFNNKLLTILEFDTLGKLSDKFIFNYGRKLREVYYVTKKVPLELYVGLYEIYNSSDRNNYSVESVWMVSIGIDNYGETKYATCASDALSYAAFFKKQYLNQFKETYSVEENLNTRGASVSKELNDPPNITGERGVLMDMKSDYNYLYHEYILIDSFASKDAIINTLKDISLKSSKNDYFIFSFSGLSNLFTTDSINYNTYFYPYNVKEERMQPVNRNKSDTSKITDNLISLKTLQEYIQLIPANNQLFISEAGPSKKFKIEFIKTLMQNSPTVAKILNKNRIIIVPNNLGLDGFNCNGKSVQKGPINYFITSLDSAYNIYDIFKEGSRPERVAFQLKNAAYECNYFENEYFDIFFEKQFLNQYKDIFGDDENRTRGSAFINNKLKEAANFKGKKYALVVGTDNYQSKNWPKLYNPVYDAKEVKDELANSYGFNVQFLPDAKMNEVYTALKNYYDSLTPNDQLIIYFAGHGDFDDKFLDDGFIVCSDSKSIEIDPIRYSYIQLSKLKKMINKIPASQILVFLDICHGGVFDDDVLGPRKRNSESNTINNKNVLQFLKDNSQYKTRRMLSSVGKEPAFDGKVGKHSPFANLLLQILGQKGAGSNGIITLSNIYDVLQTASLNESTVLKISPHKAGFGDDDVLGEFVLIPEALKISDPTLNVANKSTK